MNKFNGLLARFRFRNQYLPHITSMVDLPGFFIEIQNFFNFPLEKVELEYKTYKNYSERMDYAIRFGEQKTLCFEEAFLLYLVAKINSPKNFCEIGTQYGKSTRRIIDIFKFLNQAPVCYCYDIVKEIRYVSDDEVRFNQHDLTADFEVDVLENKSPEIIFLDAHPYQLLNKIIREYIIWSSTYPSILAIHDCSRGLYRKKMDVPKDNPSIISSYTGLWERHVLAEVFQVPDEKLDDLITTTHHLKIFPTPHGLALLAPLSIIRTPEDNL
jgi:hypothetical protein